MWLHLPDGSTFNLSTAQRIAFGSQENGPQSEWDLLAHTPDGRELVLAKYHSPQAAQQAYDSVIAQLKHGATYMALS